MKEKQTDNQQNTQTHTMPSTNNIENKIYNSQNTNKNK